MSGSAVPGQLGKYQVRGVLGKGAMGTVYDGWDPMIDRRVAIKTVRLPDAHDEEAMDSLARFKREAQAAGRLSHPNIVGVFDYGETDELAYIVMEFIEGRSLKEVLGVNDRMTVPHVIRLMEDVLNGLAYSHGRGVVHRDIKPANIMLTLDDRAKIADFGIARIEASSMTQAGTIMGTPAYMSPEQFMGQVVDLRTDIYSCGVMLYQLLTGERPFEGSMASIMHKAMSVTPPRPSELAVTSPAQLDGVVAQAMARRPEDRFASASDFAAALRNRPPLPAAAEQPRDSDATIVASPAKRAPDPTPASLPNLPAAKATSRLPLLAGSAVGGLAVLGVAAWLLLPADKPAEPQRTALPSLATPSPSVASPSASGPTATASTKPLPYPAPPPAGASTTEITTPVTPPATTPSATRSPAPPAPSPIATATPAPAAGPAPSAMPAPPANSSLPEPATAAAPDASRGPPAAPPVASPPVASPPVASPPQQTASAGATPALGSPRRTTAAVAAALASSIPSIGCSLVRTTVADDGSATVDGLAGIGRPVDSLRQAVDAAGPQATRWQVQTFDGPYCPAINLLRTVADSGQGAAGLGLQRSGGEEPLLDNQVIALRVTMPGYAGFLHMAYLQHDQTASPLVPGAGYPSQTYAARSTVALGTPRADFPGWLVGPPFGTDMIVAVSSTAPLFTRALPDSQPLGSYLAGLQAAIDGLRKRGGTVSATAIVLETRPAR